MASQRGITLGQPCDFEQIVDQKDHIIGIYLTKPPKTFFEAPEYESFNIGLLYHHLENEWLEFALELMTQFFQEDTYLIQKPTFSILRETPDHYFNQKQFADFLSVHGLHYDKRKLNVYYSRGIL
ncbi:hypothetical protein J7E79_00425 [Bacillus sp. ISL-40]|uniref:hypothetical protein n=1 Tax=unclassified Bacillus (in: firmicutes) TaxID=185979 RepID=UPI001BE6FA4E|nr:MULTISPECIES: hypothetical protein [unclassified Bacillus (in: firmicutes)]MBT2695913.1 hypothetical protein [Bacillus sp. ISL-40]MBT2739731.1 hypothetical protein [Bacillus sp. ISL-77]